MRQANLCLHLGKSALLFLAEVTGPWFSSHYSQTSFAYTILDPELLYLPPPSDEVLRNLSLAQSQRGGIKSRMPCVYAHTHGGDHNRARRSGRPFTLQPNPLVSFIAFGSLV